MDNQINIGDTVRFVNAKHGSVRGPGKEVAVNGYYAKLLDKEFEVVGFWNGGYTIDIGPEVFDVYHWRVEPITFNLENE